MTFFAPLHHGQRSAGRLATLLRRHSSIVIGAAVLALLSVSALFAPLLATGDPMAVAPALRNRPPSSDFWFGTDTLGRDLYTRILYGGQTSLLVGISVAILSSGIGLVVGLSTGINRALDMVIMRVVDGLMSIPAILFAIALMTVATPSLATVIGAITITEVPRVVRLIRSVVVTAREQPYVEAAVALGSGRLKILYLHILPSTFTPLLVQATYLCASAMIVEAALAFIGAGLPPSVPSWGNIMAEGRVLWQTKPHLVFIPAVVLSLAILSVNLLGDGLRDALDPKLAKRL